MSLVSEDIEDNRYHRASVRGLLLYAKDGVKQGKIQISELPRLTEMIESEDYESYELANSIIEQKMKE